jgi:hypothetical protein
MAEMMRCMRELQFSHLLIGNVPKAKVRRERAGKIFECCYGLKKVINIDIRARFGWKRVRRSFDAFGNFSILKNRFEQWSRRLLLR